MSTARPLQRMASLSTIQKLLGKEGAGGSLLVDSHANRSRTAMIDGVVCIADETAAKHQRTATSETGQKLAWVTGTDPTRCRSRGARRSACTRSMTHTLVQPAWCWNLHSFQRWDMQIEREAEPLCSGPVEIHQYSKRLSIELSVVTGTKRLGPATSTCPYFKQMKAKSAGRWRRP